MQTFDFKHILPLQIRFNDIDALGHVNNSVYFSFYDLGKSSYFEAVEKGPIDWRAADIVIANIHADFLAPIFMHNKIAVRTAVAEIGNKSLRMVQQIIDTDKGDIKSECTTIMVGFDPKTSEAKEISNEWRSKISLFEERDVNRIH